MIKPPTPKFPLLSLVVCVVITIIVWWLGVLQ